MNRFLLWTRGNKFQTLQKLCKHRWNFTNNFISTIVSTVLSYELGSPVSAVIANLYMESFEEQAIATSPYKPRVWKRYVDDTFTILDRESVESFLQHLNNQQPSICFTMETESGASSPFLTPQFQENQTATSPPAYTESLRTLINTYISVKSKLQQPPRAYPGHLTSFPARGEGIWLT